MKRYYVASLIHHGVLGGGLIADEESITYRTNKITVSEKYRNLRMEFKDIAYAQSGWFFVFPGISLFMKNGDSNRFIIFAPGKIRLLLESHQIEVR